MGALSVREKQHEKIQEVLHGSKMVLWILVVNMTTPWATAILLQLQPGAAEASRAWEPHMCSIQGWADSGCDEQTLQGHLGLEADCCNEGSGVVTWIVNLHCFIEAARWGQSTVSPEEVSRME